MDRGWYFRFTLVVALIVGAVLSFWPSLQTDASEQWYEPPTWVTDTFHNRIAMGLDIQGGLRMMYEVEVDQAVEDRRDLRASQVLERLCQSLSICTEDERATNEQLDETRQRVRVQSVDRDGFRLTFTTPGDASSVDADFINSFGDIRETSRNGGTVTFEMSGDQMDALRTQAVEQARGTVSERIDELGLREAGVMSREENIVVELPGASEEQFDEIRGIISRTARLEFKVLDDEGTDWISNLTLPENIRLTSERVQAGDTQATANYLVASGEGSRERLQGFIASLREGSQIPDGHDLLIGEADMGELEEGEVREEVWRTYYTHARADVTGDAIEDAGIGRDEQTGSPHVTITFNNAGARAFERLTGDNIHRRMAIVLDDRVNTAPNIQSRIGGGRAQITLGGNRAETEMLDEASDLVVVLRAGALPAPIRPANEQLIGPSLGADAVSQGIFGAAMGVLFVVLFMSLYYRTGGLIASFAVVLNLLFLLAILSILQATMTLPGIAGVALTIGMAVDANVLINERIRDEMRLGKSPASAVALGYDRAFSSIFDSQLTTFIAGVVLYQFGTGPIRGFAVSLMIGIVTSLFTSVFCTKVVFDWLVRGLRVKKLNVG